VRNDLKIIWLVLSAIRDISLSDNGYCLFLTSVLPDYFLHESEIYIHGISQDN